MLNGKVMIIHLTDKGLNKCWIDKASLVQRTYKKDLKK